LKKEEVRGRALSLASLFHKYAITSHEDIATNGKGAGTG
jgi:hypothetical protein